MKPQRFEIGQAVTPSLKVVTLETPSYGAKPIMGEIYHVEEYIHWNDERIKHCSRKGVWYVSLREYTTNFCAEDLLDPVELTSEQISALIEESITEKA